MQNYQLSLYLFFSYLNENVVCCSGGAGAGGPREGLLLEPQPPLTPPGTPPPGPGAQEAWPQPRPGGTQPRPKASHAPQHAPSSVLGCPRNEKKKSV